MAILKPGDSGPNVKKLQQTINEIYGASMVDESGDYDDATRDKVADLQKKLNIGRSSGEADPVTLRAFAVALEPKYLVELPKVTAYLTAKELADLQQVTRTVALEALKGVLSLAQKYKVIWQAHSDARGNNAFWSEVIDVVTKASFPDAQTVRKVEAAAKAIESGAKSGTLTDAAFETQSGVIRDAYAELDKYRDETFEGSDKFVDYMEKTASACGEIVDILMTVQTARLSAGGQALGAGVSGTYKAALSEVISASKTSNYSISGGIARAFASGAINGGMKYVLKGMEGEVFLKKVEEAAIKAGGTNWLTKFIPKAMLGGGQQMIEDGLKGLPGLTDPSKKLTFEDLVNAAVTSFVKGAFIKPLGEYAKSYGDTASKMFKPEHFKVPKGTTFTKEGEQFLKKTLEKVGGKIVDEVLSRMVPGTKPEKFEKDVREGILGDPEVKKAVEQAVKK